MENTIAVGNIKIFPDSREVLMNDEKLPLRKKEYELLEFLAKNAERVINRLTILEYVWNYSIYANTNTLEVHIATLRKKLAARAAEPPTSPSDAAPIATHARAAPIAPCRHRSNLTRQKLPGRQKLPRRRKLPARQKSIIIHTVHGLGYLMSANPARPAVKAF